MEDRHTVLPDFQLSPRSAGLPHQFAAVFDGHAGSRASELAAARLHDIIADQPEILAAPGVGAPDDLAVRDGLVRAFLTLDAEMARQGPAAGPGIGGWGGTTAVCALRIGGFVYVAHAGDSCALLCRAGRCLRLTTDHKPVSCPGERARIEGRGGVLLPELDAVALAGAGGAGTPGSRLCMSRALGDVEFKTPVRLVEAAPDVVRVALQPGRDEFILLLSDGILENMTEGEAVDTVRQAVRGRQASGEQLRRLGDSCLKPPPSPRSPLQRES